jgi:hypothetical protein
MKVEVVWCEKWSVMQRALKSDSLATATHSGSLS